MIVKTPFDLFCLLFQDLEDLLDVPLYHDMQTIQKRFIHEGLPFLTKTLPSFGDSFFQSLKDGAILCPSAFGRKGALPRFLNGLTSRVFDVKTGLLLNEPCYIAVYAIRQICYLLYKYEVAPTPDMIASAFQDVIETDRMLGGQVKLDPLDRVLMVAEDIICTIFDGVDFEDIIPRHGPGAAVGSPKPWEKYSMLSAAKELFDEDYVVASPSIFNVDNLDNVTVMEAPFEEMPNVHELQMLAVPKNSKSCRIIGKGHPTKIWFQLGLGEMIADTLESHPLTRGHFNFKDQTVNAQLALEGSLTGLWATLDQSKASDRIHMDLVGRLLPVQLFRLLVSSRSSIATFPPVEGTAFTGETITLEKMAPMGNGFCFPLQSLIFWALAVSVIAVEFGEVFVSDDDIRQAARRVYTYGDDLIIPSEYAELVMSSMEEYGLRFNMDKSYWTGPFRESCGLDAFKGVDVTPLKIKTNIPKKASDAEAIVSWLDMSDQWAIILPRLSKALSKTCRRALRHVPTYPEGWTGCIGMPVPFDKLKGRSVQQGDFIVKPKVKFRLKGAAVLDISRQQRAPSDGKVIKVLAQTTPRTAPKENAYPEEHRFLRALCLPSTPPTSKGGFFDIVEKGDNRSFTERNNMVLTYKKVFVG